MFVFLLISLGCASPVPTCDALDLEASAVVDAAISDHASCSVDEDCDLVWRSGSCFAHCSAYVGVGGLDAFEAALAEAEAICAEDPTCEALEPPCAPPNAPACVDGACVEGSEPAGT